MYVFLLLTFAFQERNEGAKQHLGVITHKQDRSCKCKHADAELCYRTAKLDPIPH